MVWSQYVYEATSGYDVATASSDEEDYNDEFQLNVEDWQTKYSDELWELWDMVQLLLKDAYIENHLMSKCTFSDFAEFCYNTHDEYCEYVWIPYESQLSYIWRNIQDYIDRAGLHNEFMISATFDHWVRFASQYTE